MEGVWKLVVHGSLETGALSPKLAVLEIFHTLSVGLGEGPWELRPKTSLFHEQLEGSCILCGHLVWCLFYAYYSI